MSVFVLNLSCLEMISCGLYTVYNSVEHKLELRSSLKSNDDTSNSSECDLGALFSFFVAESFLTVIPPSLNVLLYPSVENIVVCRSSGSDAVEINVSSP